MAEKQRNEKDVKTVPLGLDPERWEPVENPEPIVVGGSIPSRAPSPVRSTMNPYLRATIPQYAQLDADFARQQYTGSIPTVRLLPIAPSGQANVNAAGATQATVQVRPVQKTAAAAQTSANKAYAVTSTPAISNIASAGGVDLSNTSIVLPKGSLAGVATQPFAYTATTTSVTLTWTGMTISRLNGTITNIPNGSQTITGLTAGQTYDFYAYWNENANTLNFVQSSDVTLPPLTGVSLNGTTGQITTTNTAPNLSSTSATWEMWLYPAAGGSYQGVIEIANSKTGTPTNASLTLENSGTYLRVWVGSTLEFTASKSMVPNAWNYVVLTWDYFSGSGTLTLYLNGVNVGGLASITTMPSITGYYRIGYESPPTWSTYFFDGYMSHVAVYPSFLTSTQITNHYDTMIQQGVGTYESLVATDGATSLWKFTETSGTTAADSIGTNAGTYTGGYTLNASADIGQAQGSPAIAWQNAPYAVTQFQYLQSHAPLAAGPFPVSTPSSGTAGGLNGGFYVPNIPTGLTFY